MGWRRRVEMGGVKGGEGRAHQLRDLALEEERVDSDGGRGWGRGQIRGWVERAG